MAFPRGSKLREILEISGCGFLAKPDGVAEGREAGQFPRPTTFAGWLENEASGLLAAHLLGGAGRINGFTAFRALKAQDVEEFAGGGIQFVGG
jgi:hypothetical protein